MRGTLPISRNDSVRYGGNTSCVSLSLPDGRLFIFDAGSGIKALSDALLAAKRTRIDGKILISHPHWDHINALPFFAPFYVQGNQFEICGASHGDITMRDLVSAQMDGVYFPVTVHEFAAEHHLPRPERGRVRDRRRHGQDDAPQPSRQLPGLPDRATAGARSAT